MSRSACFCCIAKEVMIGLICGSAQNSVRSTASVLLAARRKAIWRLRGMAGSGKEAVRFTGSRHDPNESQFRSMPRYFFNTRIGDELIADPEGEELRNPDRAWEMARAMIRELLKTEGAERGLFNAILEVTDGKGEIVLEFPFAEALLDMSEIAPTRH